MLPQGQSPLGGGHVRERCHLREEHRETDGAIISSSYSLVDAGYRQAQVHRGLRTAAARAGRIERR